LENFWVDLSSTFSPTWCWKSLRPLFSVLQVLILPFHCLSANCCLQHFFKIWIWSNTQRSEYSDKVLIKWSVWHLLLDMQSCFCIETILKTAIQL
jgi:hypothetical protein